MIGLPYTIEELRRAFSSGNIIWTEHSLQKMIIRRISRHEVAECINSGEIIEAYIDDKPIPSCLVLGITVKKRHIHVCCSYTDMKIYIITAYIPDTEKWEKDLKTRKKVF